MQNFLKLNGWTTGFLLGLGVYAQAANSPLLDNLDAHRANLAGIFEVAAENNAVSAMIGARNGRRDPNRKNPPRRRSHRGERGDSGGDRKRGDHESSRPDSSRRKSDSWDGTRSEKSRGSCGGSRKERR